MSAPTTRPPEPTAPPEHVNGSGAAAPNTGTAAKSGVPKRIAPYQLTGAESGVRSLEELDVEVETPPVDVDTPPEVELVLEVMPPVVVEVTTTLPPPPLLLPPKKPPKKPPPKPP